MLAESVREKLSNQEAKKADAPSTPKTPYQYHTGLKQIVQILYESEREMTRIESQKTLKMSNKTHFLTEYLRSALEAGLIKITIPDRRAKSSCVKPCCNRLALMCRRNNSCALDVVVSDVIV